MLELCSAPTYDQLVRHENDAIFGCVSVPNVLRIFDSGGGQFAQRGTIFPVSFCVAFYSPNFADCADPQRPALITRKRSDGVRFKRQIDAFASDPIKQE